MGIGIGEMVFAIILLAAILIAIHRPRLLVWSVGLVFLFIVVSSIAVYLSFAHAPWQVTQWSAQHPGVAVQFQPRSIPAWPKFGLLVLLVCGLLFVNKLLRGGHRDGRMEAGEAHWHEARRGGSWAGTLALLAAAILGVMVLAMFWARGSVSMNVAQRQQQQMMENFRQAQQNTKQKFDAAQQEAQQRFEKALQPANIPPNQYQGIIQPPAPPGIHKLMDEFDKPRIPLPPVATPPTPDAPDANKKLSFAEAKTLIEGDQSAEKEKQEPEKSAAGATEAQEHSDAEQVDVEQSADESSTTGTVTTATKKPPTENPTAEAISPARNSEDALATATVAETKGDAAPAPPANSAATASAGLSAPRMLRIQFDRNRLNRNGITFGQVAAMFLNRPSGRDRYIKLDAKQMTIEVEVNSPYAAGFGEMRINAQSGQSIFLSQLADSVTTFNGLPEKTATPGVRPAWVDEPPNRSGDVWRQVAVAGDFATVEECNQRADEMLYTATWAHLQTLLGKEISGADQLFLAGPDQSDLRSGYYSYNWSNQYALNAMGVGMDFIRREIVPKPPAGEYLETVQRSVGPMKRLYTRLEFTPQVDAYLKEHWTAREQGWRMAAVGTTGGVILGCIGFLYGLLKVDTLTKGYYTKRLFIGVPAMIVGLVLLAMLVSG